MNQWKSDQLNHSKNVCAATKHSYVEIVHAADHGNELATCSWRGSLTEDLEFH